MSQLQREALSVLQFGNFLQSLRGAGCMYVWGSLQDMLVFLSGVFCRGL